MKTEKEDLGKALYEYSLKNPQKGKSIDSALFPYVYLASQHLSTRAISEYFEKEKNIKISHSTISTALRNKDDYFDVFTRKISACVQDWLDYCTPCFGERDATVVDVLYDHKQLFNDMMSDKPSMEHMFETGIDVACSIKVVALEWAPLPDEFKMDCLPYFMKLLNEKTNRKKEEI